MKPLQRTFYNYWTFFKLHYVIAIHRLQFGCSLFEMHYFQKALKSFTFHKINASFDLYKQFSHTVTGLGNMGLHCIAVWRLPVIEFYLSTGPMLSIFVPNKNWEILKFLFKGNIQMVQYGKPSQIVGEVHLLFYAPIMQSSNVIVLNTRWRRWIIIYALCGVSVIWYEVLYIVWQTLYLNVNSHRGDSLLFCSWHLWAAAQRPVCPFNV